MDATEDPAILNSELEYIVRETGQLFTLEDAQYGKLLVEPYVVHVKASMMAFVKNIWRVTGNISCFKFYAWQLSMNMPWLLNFLI